MLEVEGASAAHLLLYELPIFFKIYLDPRHKPCRQRSGKRSGQKIRDNEDWNNDNDNDNDKNTATIYSPD